MGQHGSKRLDHNNETEVETVITDEGGSTIKSVLIVTLEQQKIDIGEKLRILLSYENRLSVYDATEGKLETLLKNADAVLLICSDNLQSLLSNGKKVAIKMENAEVQIDCGVIYNYILNGDKKEKFITVSYDPSHIPNALKGNFSYIFPTDETLDERDFLSKVRPQIESL